MFWVQGKKEGRQRLSALLEEVGVADVMSANSLVRTDIKGRLTDVLI